MVTTPEETTSMITEKTFDETASEAELTGKSFLMILDISRLLMLSLKLSLI